WKHRLTRAGGLFAVAQLGFLERSLQRAYRRLLALNILPKELDRRIAVTAARNIHLGTQHDCIIHGPVDLLLESIPFLAEANDLLVALGNSAPERMDDIRSAEGHLMMVRDGPAQAAIDVTQSLRIHRTPGELKELANGRRQLATNAEYAKAIAV